MLNERQIEVIRTTFLAVFPLTDQAASHFYTRLFALAPETRALFPEDMAAQGRKLFMMLATIVDRLDRMETVMPAARELARRHVRYGAQDRHYAVVGQALMETLKHHTGPSFDDEAEDAWAAAYAMLSGVMISAARSDNV